MSALDIKIIDNTRLVEEALPEQIYRALRIAAETAEGYAKKEITEKKAVDTGRLRASISHKVDKENKCAYIGTNVEYAPYVEFGTGQRAEPGMGGNQSIKGMAPRPYLRPAIANHVEEYRSIMTEELSH